MNADSKAKKHEEITVSALDPHAFPWKYLRWIHSIFIALDTQVYILT